MKDDCLYCWHSHGCDLPEGHEGEHLCLNRNYDGGDGSVFCETCREWCSSGATMDFYDLCSTRPRGHPDVFHGRTDEPETV